MAGPRFREIYPLPIPIQGVNYLDPLSAMDQRFSPKSTNFLFENQYQRLRPGWHIHARPVSGQNVLALAQWGIPAQGSSNKLFAYVRNTSSAKNEIWDISTGTPSKVVDLADNDATEAWPAYYFNQTAFVVDVSASDEAKVYDGASWLAFDGTAAGFTTAGTPIIARIVVQYKGRVYLFGRAALGNVGSVYYGALGALKGATTARALDQYFQYSSIISWAGVLGAPGDRPGEQYFAFGNLEGEIVVFTGDYPDASNWELIGRFFIGPTIGYGASIELNNDIWILARTGIISLRDLLTNGSQAIIEAAYSKYINPHWLVLANQTVANLAGKHKAVYIATSGRLHIIYEYTYDGFASAGGITMYVYNAFNKSWSVCEGPGILGSASTNIGSPIYYKGDLYFIVNDCVYAQTPTNSLSDERQSDGANLPLTFRLDGAYTDLGSKKSKKVQGFEPLFNNGFTDASGLSLKAESDMSRATSGSSTQAIPTGYTSVYYPVGIEGDYIHWQITGTVSSADASTVGLNFSLHGMGAVIE